MPDTVREYLRSLALAMAILVEVLRDFSSPLVGLLAPHQWLGGGAAAALFFLLGYRLGRRRAGRGPAVEAPVRGVPAPPAGLPGAGRASDAAEARLMDVSGFRDPDVEAGRRRRR